MWAHIGRCAVQPDLLFVKPRCDQRFDIEGNPKGLRNVDVLDRQLPGQEHLGAIVLGREFGRIKAAAVARDDGVRLAGIEDHHRASDQGYPMACGGKVHVEPPVLTQKKVAEGRTAIVCGVMVVPRATAGH